MSFSKHNLNFNNSQSCKKRYYMGPTNYCHYIYYPPEDWLVPQYPNNHFQNQQTANTDTQIQQVFFKILSTYWQYWHECTKAYFQNSILFVLFWNLKIPISNLKKPFFMQICWFPNKKVKNEWHERFHKRLLFHSFYVLTIYTFWLANQQNVNKPADWVKLFSLVIQSYFNN